MPLGRAISSSCDPCSTMPSSVSTRIVSALRMVVSRWAMVKVVRPLHQLFQRLLHQAFGSRCPARWSPHPGSVSAGSSGTRARWKCAASGRRRAARRARRRWCRSRVQSSMMKSCAPASFAAANDLLAAGAGPAVFDVAQRRSRRTCTRPAAPRRCGCAGICSVNSRISWPSMQDAPPRHVVEAGNQAAQRGLAAAGRADQRHALAAAHLQVDVAEHACAAVRRRRRTRGRSRYRRARSAAPRASGRSVNARTRRIHDRRKALNAGDAALELLRKFHEAADGGQQRRAHRADRPPGLRR